MEALLGAIAGLPAPLITCCCAVGALLLALVLVKVLSGRVPSIQVSLDAGGFSAFRPCSSTRPPTSPCLPADDVPGGKCDPAKAPKGSIPCYDPGSLELLGYAPAMTAAQVGGRAGGPAMHACAGRRGSDRQLTARVALLS